MSTGEREGQRFECPYCKDVLGEEETSCPGCGARYHPECWEELGGCATLGCERKGPRRPGGLRGEASGALEQAAGTKLQRDATVGLTALWSWGQWALFVGLLASFTAPMVFFGGVAAWDMLNGEFGATERFPSGRLPAFLGCAVLGGPCALVLVLAVRRWLREGSSSSAD